MILYLEDINRFSFSGGERHVTLPSDGDKLDKLVARIRNSDDLMDLMLVTDILERQNRKPDTLYIPYMPYARQDRHTSPDTSFSLLIAAKMINSLNYKRVVVYEPHSDVTGAVINNIRIINSDSNALLFCNHIAKHFQLKEKIVVVAPDGGAIKRIERFLAYVPKDDGVNIEYFGVGIKHRDVNTGRVNIRDVVGDLQDKHVLIIDDICDGGATFIQLAAAIRKKQTVKSLNLFVAHGIFSKGTEVVSSQFDLIGTTNSFYLAESEKENIKVYSAIY